MAELVGEAGMTMDPWYRRRRRQAELGTNRVLFAARRAFLLMCFLVVVLWVVEFVDVASGHRLDTLGITPRAHNEVPDILTAPIMHASFDHLAGNTIPLFILGFLTALSGLGRFAVVSAVIVVASGIGVWSVATPGTVHLGASGLIFGYFGYLVARGLLDRRIRDLLVAVAVVLIYGFAVLSGVLPGQRGISWEAHLFGLLGGIFAAWILRRPAGSGVP
jgi:membrane associated rhomboid family serine protease